MDDPKRILGFALVTIALIGGARLALEKFGPEPDVDPAAESGTSAQDEAAPPPAESPAASPGSDSAPAAPLTEEQRQQRAAGAQTATIETDQFIATFTNLNTALSSFLVKGERYHDENDQPQQMVTTSAEDYLPLRAEFDGITIPEDAAWELHQPEANVVEFRYRGDGFGVVRRWEAGHVPYQLWSTVVVHNDANWERQIRLTMHTSLYVTNEDQDGGFMGRPSPRMGFANCLYNGDELERIDHSDLDADEPSTEVAAHTQEQHFGPNVEWVGTSNAYFATLMAVSEHAAERCDAVVSHRGRGGAVEGTMFETRLRYPAMSVAPGADQQIRTAVYIGPKDVDALHAFGRSTAQVIDLGWFSLIAEGLTWLLRTIEGFVGNWGLAIILLTFLVKLILLPLTHASFANMAKMSELKPEIDALNEKFGDDREAKGQATMALYRKHNINPLLGCLPMLGQMPVWFALYQSLSTNVELYHAPFVWVWQDLSSRDPYFILPLGLGVLMFVQQQFSPNTMPPEQARIMKWVMPIMITAFMLFLPAGLCLYMVTNSTLSILQQYWIKKNIAKKSEAKAARAADTDS